MKFTLRVLFVLFVVFSVVEIQADYTIPDVKIELLKPKNLRVALPDSPGIQHFAFHANINKPIKDTDEGEIYFGASSPYEGNWMFIDDESAVQKGDVLHYWISVYKNDTSYKRSDLSYKVQ